MFNFKIIKEKHKMKKSINEILEDLKNLNIPSSYEEIDYKNIENQRIKIKKYIKKFFF